jgi:hypothetical protein
MPERNLVGQLAPILTREGRALDPDKQRELIRILCEERTRFTFSTDLSEPDLLDEESLTPAHIEQYLAELSALHEKMAARAKPLLTPEQHARLTDFLDRHYSTRRSRIELQAYRFARQAPNTEPEPAPDPE